MNVGVTAPSLSHVTTSCYIHHAAFLCSFFFFNDTATTEIYTLSLHDALPICATANGIQAAGLSPLVRANGESGIYLRSEEHTSELQSPCNLVCRLLLEKKKHPTVNTTCYIDHTALLITTHHDTNNIRKPLFQR